METQPEHMAKGGPGLRGIGRSPVLLGGCGLAALVGLACMVPMPGEGERRAAPGAAPAEVARPMEAPPSPLAGGAGRPHGPGEIGTVLSILFRDRPRPADALREPASPGPADAVREPMSPGPADAGPAVTASPAGSPPDADETRSIQARLTALGFEAADESGVWGPQTRQALRAFKSARQLPSDELWDEATEAALFGGAAPRKAEAYAGVWAPHPKACSPQTNRKGLLPAVIGPEGAWAGDVSCSFRNGRREGDGWRFLAACSGARKRWTANVRLTVAGDVLTWSSERGSQRYVRCPSSLG